MTLRNFLVRAPSSGEQLLLRSLKQSFPPQFVLQIGDVLSQVLHQSLLLVFR